MVQLMTRYEFHFKKLFKLKEIKINKNIEMGKKYYYSFLNKNFKKYLSNFQSIDFRMKNFLLHHIIIKFINT